MPDSPVFPAARAQRDPRLDVFRGLSLVMIFINHVPGTVFETLTSRNFGFSDAAEGFVLMSGIAAGLAYGRSFRVPPFWPGTARVWHRAWTLYLVHLFTVVWMIAIAAATALWFGSTRLLFANGLQVLFTNPLGFLVGVPLLTHQPGYVNILPMYAVLLLATPPMLWLAQRRAGALVALSVLLWLGAGLWEVGLPNFPNPGVWFFNPLSWQILFVTGLLCGIGAREGRPLVPTRRRLQGAAAAMVVAGVVWSKVPGVNEALTGAMQAAEGAGVPRFLAMIDKTYVTWPRLLHILAVAYLLASVPAVRRLAGSRVAAPLALLGRQALPVFALGTILALVAQAARDVAAPSQLLDAGLIAGGIGVQVLFAGARDRFGTKHR